MKFSTVFVLILLVGALPLAAENVEGYLVDKMCSGKITEKGVGAAKTHTKMCALMPDCKAGGFGVVTGEGEFLKFDGQGDKLALKALEGTDKKDNISVKVDGKVKGDNIAVKGLSLT